MYIALTIFIPILLFIIIGIFRIREIVFTENAIFYQSFWTKRKRWSISYNIIDSIKVNYLSDTKTNNKKILVVKNDGSIMKANVLNLKMEELGKITKMHNLKLYYNLNNEFVVYQNNP